jgi:membrane protease subunit HflC
MQGKIWPVLIVALLVVAGLSVFTVHQREKAILFQLGRIVRSDFTPGLYFKIPLFQNVETFDARIQTLDAPPELYLTSEKKNVLVDSYVKWRIKDVQRFYTATGGNVERANARLGQVIKKGLKDEFGKRTVQEVVSGERAKIMDILSVSANDAAQEFGIEVVDVRVKRIDLPPEVSSSVYRRMAAERQRVAREFRARGSEEAKRIRARAEREREVTLAEADRDSQQIRGEGDGKSAEIYAKAYSEDPEFYGFYRSLNAYRETLRDKGDVLVLEPDSEFFRYFKQAGPER